MALQTNNITYDKIMIPLRDKLRNEFEGSLPVYIDSKHKNIGSKYLRIFIDSQSLFTRRAKAFTNLYDIEIDYVLKTNRINEKALDEMYKDVSRIETLLINNTHNNSYFFNTKPNIQMNFDIGLDNCLVARITIPVLHQELIDRYVKYITSDNKNFVTSGGSFYIVRS
tara:strand:+ start:3326 stop:3829 length:504 start_codon:yes stop_codon:yes gene_type:complete